MRENIALNYGHLMQRAMRSMMADVLSQVAEDGLPGDHHFYICFETGHPGVDIPDWLRETYPEEMTIVLQDWFKDLVVVQDRFSVTLNFSDQAQTLVIPLAAVRTFVDPSVKFGLKFDAYDPEEEQLDPKMPEELELDTPEAEEAEASAGAEVVSIDKFRKS
ncbi:MAG: ClpXP protease specificity-enhancing factor SspB [Pseudomonadota bacterium]